MKHGTRLPGVSSSVAYRPKNAPLVGFYTPCCPRVVCVTALSLLIRLSVTEGRYVRVGRATFMEVLLCVNYYISGRLLSLPGLHLRVQSVSTEAVSRRGCGWFGFLRNDGIEAHPHGSGIAGYVDIHIRFAWKPILYYCRCIVGETLHEPNCSIFVRIDLQLFYNKTPAFSEPCSSLMSSKTQSVHV